MKMKEVVGEPLKKEKKQKYLLNLYWIGYMTAWTQKDMKICLFIYGTTRPKNLSKDYKKILDEISDFPSAMILDVDETINPYVDLEEE